MTVLLVHTNRDTEDLGPDDTKKEHSVMCIATSKTSHARATLVDEGGLNLIGQEAEAGLNGRSSALYNCPCEPYRP